MVLSSVSPPLASAYLKLIGAQEHLDPLVASIRRYEMSQPYDTVRAIDHVAGEHSVYARLRQPPGDEWYGPLGDLIHDLRAALDHAVFGLSSFCQGRQLSDDEARSTAWPVVSRPADHAEFVRTGRWAVRFLSEPFREVVESEQPWRGSNDYLRASHPLHVLHHLWNLDKHRRINFFATFGTVVAVLAGGGPVPFRVTPAVASACSDVATIAEDQVDANEALHPVVIVTAALLEGGPPLGQASGAPRALTGLLGEMHGRVFSVLQGVTDLIERGVR
jgi:hypothetical protein